MYNNPPFHCTILVLAHHLYTKLIKIKINLKNRACFCSSFQLILFQAELLWQKSQSATRIKPTAGKIERTDGKLNIISYSSISNVTDVELIQIFIKDR